MVYYKFAALQKVRLGILEVKLDSAEARHHQTHFDDILHKDCMMKNGSEMNVVTPHSF
jgi:hypothetical protein